MSETTDQFLRRKHWVLRYGEGAAKAAGLHANQAFNAAAQKIPLDLATKTRGEVSRIVSAASALIVIEAIDLTDYWVEEVSAYTAIIAGAAAVPDATRAVVADYKRVIGEPYNGKSIHKWTADIQIEARAAVGAAILSAWAGGETPDQVADRISLISGKSADDARIVARSAAGHLSNQAIEYTYDQNRDIIAYKTWLSTLDGRTTMTCMARDGKRWTLDNKPIGHDLAWGTGPGSIHWQCRSTSVPVLKSEADIGTRSSVNYNKETRSKAGSVVDGYGRGEQIDGKISYGEWLRNQPEWFIQDTLGKERAALFRSGQVQIEQFTNEKGRELTLAEIKKRHQLSALEK